MEIKQYTHVNVNTNAHVRRKLSGISRAHSRAQSRDFSAKTRKRTESLDKDTEKTKRPPASRARSRQFLVRHTETREPTRTCAASLGQSLGRRLGRRLGQRHGSPRICAGLLGQAFLGPFDSHGISRGGLFPTIASLVDFSWVSRRWHGFARDFSGVSCGFPGAGTDSHGIAWGFRVGAPTSNITKKEPPAASPCNSSAAIVVRNQKRRSAPTSWACLLKFWPFLSPLTYYLLTFHDPETVFETFLGKRCPSPLASFLQKMCSTFHTQETAAPHKSDAFKMWKLSIKTEQK